MKSRVVVPALASSLLAAIASAAPDPLAPTSIAGSDTMREISVDLINACGVGGSVGSLAASLQYIGGGSSTGGNALRLGDQQVAPMSRFLNATECNAVATNRGQGIAIGLDGIALFRDNTEDQACRTLRYAGCMEVQDLNNAAALGFGNGAPGIDDGTGAGAISSLGLSDGPDGDGILDHYCFTHWAEALRILYTGQHAHSLASTPQAACNPNAPSAEPLANKRCNSDVRRTLVESWANLFDEASEDGAGGCTDIHCTRLSHAWRRDDFSGTTDVFLSLIGAPGIGGSFNVRTFCNGLELEDLDPIRRTCANTGNINTAANDTETVCSPIPFANRRSPFGTDGSPTGAQGACNLLAQPPITTNCPVAPASGAVGDLGLVLAVSIPNQDFSTTPPTVIPATGNLSEERYDPTACALTGGSFALADVKASLRPYCPNGNAPVLGNKCFYPVRSGRFNCRATRLTRPAVRVWSNFDARAYNLTPHSNILVNGIPSGKLISDLNTPNSQGVSDPRWGFGGHYRIHMVRANAPQTATPLTGAHPACMQIDATTQIGCLVQADLCSVGFAGLEAEDGDISDAEVAIAGTNAPFLLRVPLDPDTAETTAGDDLELDPSPSSVQRLVDVTGAPGTPERATCEAGGSNFDGRYSFARTLYLNASKGFGDFPAPGTLSTITNVVDSSDADTAPDLVTRENDFAQCYRNRALMKPILESHGFIDLPPAAIFPESRRLRTCPP